MHYWRTEMLNKTLFEGKTPLTQSAKAVKQLIEFVSGKPCDELPANFALSNCAQLTKSSKGDVFYVTTPTACSCPGFTYRGSCKHVTALMSGKGVEASRSQAQAYQARQRELRAKAKAGGSLPEPTGHGRRLARLPEDSIMPEAKWPGGMNGPVNEIQGAA
jgi:hypothetical protein